MPTLPRGTVTFLFSDVAGSTRLLRELGHERYGQALADYQRLLRESSARQSGHEVDTQGDAFFFAFARARDAVRAAADAQRSLADHDWPEGLPLRARIGLHTGEASVANGRYVGLSVHRAARVCGAAAGGQVLVSQTSASVLEDEELGELRLRALGRRALKDFERPVQLHQLDVPGLPSKFQRRRGARRPLRRSVLAVAIGVVAVIGAAVAIPLALVGGGSRELTRLGPTSAGIIDPTTSQLAGEIALGFRSSLIAAGEGRVWIVDAQRSTVTTIDPRSRKVAESFGIQTVGIPTGIAVGGGSVWVAVNRGHSLAVIELGPNAGERRRAITVDTNPTATFPSTAPLLLAFGRESLWALEVGTGEVWRIDTATGRRDPRPLTEGADALSIAYGHGAVWLGGQDGVTKLDPDTGTQRSQDLVLAHSESTALAIGSDTVWFAASGEPILFSFEPRTMGFTTFDVGPGPRGIAVNEDGAWVASGADRTVTRVDPHTGAKATIPVGNSPGEIVSAFGLVWTTPGEPAASS